MSNVMGFGAVGDGKNDDTNAILHALNDGDGHIEFSRGDYLITRTITVPMEKWGRCSISGSGGTAKIIMAGAGPAFDFVGTHTGTADPNDFRPEQWQRERMPTVSNIEIEGRHPEADGLRIRGLMQCTLTGLLIRHVRNAVHITDRARNVLISQCHVYHNTGVGIYFEKVNLHQAIIVGSHISYNMHGGIRIVDSEVRNLQITGNDIEYNNANAFKKSATNGSKTITDEPTAEIWIECGEKGTVREWTIASNTIQATYSPNGANIRLIGRTKGPNYAAGMGAISGNLIGSQSINIHMTSCRGITISGNHIYSGHVRNLLAENCQDIVLGNNVFGHNPDYGDKELATGIRFVDCVGCNLNGLVVQQAIAGKSTVALPEDTALESNLERQGLIELMRCDRMMLNALQVFDGVPVGIRLDECNRTTISNSQILETRTPGLTTHAVYWVGPGIDNLICNCTMDRPVELPSQVSVR